MTETIVLILILALPGGKDLVWTQEFNSMENCHSAWKVIRKETDKDEVKGFCIKK